MIGTQQLSESKSRSHPRWLATQVKRSWKCLWNGWGFNGSAWSDQHGTFLLYWFIHSKSYCKEKSGRQSKGPREQQSREVTIEVGEHGSNVSLSFWFHGLECPHQVGSHSSNLAYARFQTPSWKLLGEISAVDDCKGYLHWRPQDCWKATPSHPLSFDCYRNRFRQLPSCWYQRLPVRSLCEH